MNEHDSDEAVWQDPTGYDVQRHGPPYLPTKLAHDKRAAVRSWLCRQAAFYDTGPSMISDEPYSVLAQMLAGLRAGYLLHQTAHWQTRGAAYYGDHMLYQRIYEDTQEGIDGLAERLVGLTGDPTQVALCDQVSLIHQFVKLFHEGAPASPLPDELPNIGLRAEVILLGVFDEVIKRLQSADAMTAGLDDLLPAIAGKHEEFVYLLKQRASANNTPGYANSYDRR